MRLIILGSHKSGTTLISQILHYSGINMVDDPKVQGDYDQGIFYERESFRSINKSILNCRSASMLATESPNIDDLTFNQHQQLQDLIHCLDKKYPRWGFKDPRTCLTYHLLKKYLPNHKLIVIYRSPSESWQRYLRNFSLSPYVAWKYIKKWCESNALILDALQNHTKDSIVLNYYKFITRKSEIKKLEKFIGTELMDLRDIKKYRCQPRENNAFKFGSWLAYKQTGLDFKRILAQLGKWEITL